MNYQEYFKCSTMTYREYCKYLQDKYGFSPCKYTFGSSGKDKRSNDGLELHHIREDIVPALSNRTVAESNPIEYQQPQNLCYCDYLEHMLLHVLIFEEDMENNYTDNVVGIMGVINHMVKRLNDFYCKDLVGYKDYEIIAYHKIKDDVDVYLEIIKRIFGATPQNIHSTICNKLCMSKNNSEECQELRNNLYNDITEMISIVQEHNKEFAKKIDETIANSNKCLFILGTSLGKTTTGLDYIIKHGIRGLVVHHQNNIKDVWNKNNDLVDTVSIQTLCRNYSSYNFSKYGLIIFDEAHHLSAPEWGKPIRFCIDNNIPVLCLTATPKKEVEDLFGKDNVVYGYDVFEGIEKGILHPVSYVGALYALPDKIKHAKEHPEELTPILKGKLDIALNNTPTVAEILYRNMPSGNRKGIIFAQDISDMDDAIDIVKNVFPDYDYKFISSHETKVHNNNVKEWFEKTDRGFICSVDMVSEGSHFNGVNTLIMLRKTKSRIKFEQQLGRVMVQTKYPDPNCIVFDLVNNALTTELFTEKLRKAVEGRGDVSVIHPGDDVIKDPNKKYIIVEDYTKPLVELNKSLNGFWTEEEDDVLRKHYQISGARGCAEILTKRTIESIKKRAQFLSIVRPSSKIWTEEEDEIIKKYYQSGGYKKCRELLPNREKDSIVHRAKLLECKINTSWGEEEDAIVKKYYPVGGAKECLKYLPNRTTMAINRRAKVLKVRAAVGKMIICLETGVIYISIKEAEKVVCISNISAAISGKYKTAGGYHWAYVDDYNSWNIEKQNEHFGKKPILKEKMVKCVETGEIYKTINEASENIGISSNGISNALKGRCKTSGGYHWEYVEKENEEETNKE